MDSYNIVLGLFTVAILALATIFSAPEAVLAQDLLVRLLAVIYYFIFSGHPG